MMICIYMINNISTEEYPDPQDCRLATFVLKEALTFPVVYSFKGHCCPLPRGRVYPDLYLTDDKYQSFHFQYYIYFKSASLISLRSLRNLTDSTLPSSLSFPPSLLSINILRASYISDTDHQRQTRHFLSHTTVKFSPNT